MLNGFVGLLEEVDYERQGLLYQALSVSQERPPDTRFRVARHSWWSCSPYHLTFAEAFPMYGEAETGSVLRSK